MFKVYFSDDTERKFIKEIINDELSNRTKVNTKNELGYLKEGLTACTCLEFYDENDVFVDCAKFHCVGKENCSCCADSDCKGLEVKSVE